MFKEFVEAAKKIDLSCDYIGTYFQNNKIEPTPEAAIIYMKDFLK